jgi:hypothetical protein
MAFLLKRQDGLDIAKQRYCPVQNETYGQPTHVTQFCFAILVRPPGQ